MQLAKSQKIDKNLKDNVTFELSWSDIAGLRDKISHDYRGVDGDILWLVIHKDLQKLKTVLIDMLHSIRAFTRVLKYSIL